MRMTFVCISVLLITSCATVRPRYHTVVHPTTLGNLYGDLGLDIHHTDIDIAWDHVLQSGDRVYIPFELFPVGDSSPKGRKPQGAPKLIWPVEGGVFTSGFGKRLGRMHEGIDLAAPKGTPIYAAAGGEVIYSSDAIRGYGNMVIVKHRGGWVTVYAHNKENFVTKGQKVMQGTVIAKVGNTGHTQGSHLHFEVRKYKIPKNPLWFLPKKDRQELRLAKK